MRLGDSGERGGLRRGLEVKLKACADDSGLRPGGAVRQRLGGWRASATGQRSNFGPESGAPDWRRGGSAGGPGMQLASSLGPRRTSIWHVCATRPHRAPQAAVEGVGSIEMAARQRLPSAVPARRGGSTHPPAREKAPATCQRGCFLTRSLAFETRDICMRAMPGPPPQAARSICAASS